MMISRRTLYIILGILALSLMANLFLAGVIGGRMLKSDGGATRLAALVGERLPADTRRVLRREILDHRQELRAAVEDIRKARAGVRTALAADPYDAKATAQAFERLRGATTRVQAVMQQLVADAATDMPPEMRRKLAKRWQRALDRAGH